MLVRLFLKYASEVWNHPHKKQQLKDKLEGVQRLALRIILSRYRRLDSPTTLYAKADLALLETRSRNKILKMLYLILRDSSSIEKSKFLTYSDSRITQNKHNKTLNEYSCYKDAPKYSFFYVLYETGIPSSKQL